jgi:hypothetical protein
VNAHNDVGLGKTQQVIIAFEITGPILEPLAAVVGFGEFVALYHCTHGTVDDEYAFVEFFANVAHSLLLLALRHK